MAPSVCPFDGEDVYIYDAPTKYPPKRVSTRASFRLALFQGKAFAANRPRQQDLSSDTPWASRSNKPNKRPGTKFTVHIDLFHQLAKRCVSSGHIPEASAMVRLRFAIRRQIHKRRTIPTVHTHRICPPDITPRSRTRGFSRPGLEEMSLHDRLNASPDVIEDPGLQSYIYIAVTVETAPFTRGRGPCR